MNFDLGIITATQLDGRHVQGQVDGYGANAAVPFGDVHWISGICHRSLDPGLDNDGQPVATKSCQALYFWEGGRLHVIPTVDPRIVAKMPPLKKGSTIIPCANGSFVQADGDGNIQLYVPYGASASVVEISVETGAITARTGEGAGCVLNGSTALIHSGNGQTFMEIRDDGITLAGNVKVQGALMGPVPPGLPVMNATLTPSVFLGGF